MSGGIDYCVSKIQFSADIYRIQFADMISLIDRKHQSYCTVVA